MEMTNKDIMELMNDVHNKFFKKYRDMNLTSDSDEWEQVVSDASAIMKKYDQFHYESEYKGTGGSNDSNTVYPANELVLWFLGVLERRCNKQ